MKLETIQSSLHCTWISVSFLSVIEITVFEFEFYMRRDDDICGHTMKGDVLNGMSVKGVCWPTVQRSSFYL